ncbi:MAG: hypothetical protein WDW36_009334 [Sanguina aurantia]
MACLVSAESRERAGVSRIAFGSCTAYDLRSQPVWTQGVIPSAPHAWIWLGDMAYTDTSDADCSLYPSFPQCNCSSNFYAYPGQCNAGNLDHARERLAYQLSLPEYMAFLEYSCPGARAAGHFPPTGSDPAMCPRPILGTYDDHDFGWNNGNKRLPNKQAFKELFLDALGEPRGSRRRNSATGLQTNYTLNRGTKGQEVDILVLDERYYRDTLPCHMRRDWCTLQLSTATPGSTAYVLCYDFLVNDGKTGVGSCCTRDEDWAGYCSRSSPSDPHWTALCDPTSADFGMRRLALSSDNTTVVELGAGAPWDGAVLAAGWRHTPVKDMSQSSMCEMLGLQQRRWMAEHLAASTAPLTLVVSGSVLLGSVGFRDRKGACSEDDWGCWNPAQVNFLHTLANASGCVVVMTGDYHYGDIKVANSSGALYSDVLKTGSLAKNVFQVMGSGMTGSTARGAAASPCMGTYRQDLVGLRPGGVCSYTPEPNFGMVAIDWSKNVAHLQVLSAASGSVAKGIDGSTLELVVDLATCTAL